MLTKPPTINSCFRYVGPGLSNGILQRVVVSNKREVVAVQESREPAFAWFGTVVEFHKVFVFVVGPAPSWDRTRGHLFD